MDARALAEAQRLIEKADMSTFKPAGDAPASTGGELVSIDLIDSPSRAPGVPIFDNPDPDRPDVCRSSEILAALRKGTSLPPITLFQKGDGRYELRDGYHRLHLIAALGYTHVAATFTDWKLGEF